MAKKGKSLVEKMRSRPGGSNYGKYKPEKGKTMSFAGPGGGAPKGTYPVTNSAGKLDKGRVNAALAYAHNAPNPEGIRKSVARIVRKKGDKTLAQRILAKKAR